MHTIKTALLVAALWAPATAALAADQVAVRIAHTDGWLVESVADLHRGIQAPARAEPELRELAVIIAKRNPADIERVLWWDAGGPAYRWNQIAIDEMLNAFVTTVPATRNLALLHTAIDDAVAAAWAAKQVFRRPRPSQLDPSIVTAVAVPGSPSYPSDYAAAAAAAAEVLGHLLPDRSGAFEARAEEAMQTRLLAGVEYPSDMATGRAIGRKAAALAIQRAKSEGFDAKWAGSVPQGPEKWKGTAPIWPLAGTWRPWVLAHADEFRPAAPPAFDSDQVRSALSELKSIERTPAAIHRATYWEVFGGARAYALWNEIARTKLLEYRAAYDEPASARAFATLNAATHDATIACFEAKYAYWYIRPSQLDPALQTIFPPPNHPSYPGAHACLSTAAATVLAKLFPRDAQRLLAMAEEAGASRLWAGIHYRFDIEAGAALGRQVADKVLFRAFSKR